MNGILEQAKNLYSLTECVLVPVERHEDGRNQLFIVRRNGENQYVLRVSALGDRTEENYLAETSFVRYLAQNGAPVADVIPILMKSFVPFVGKITQLHLCAFWPTREIVAAELTGN